MKFTEKLKAKKADKIENLTKQYGNKMAIKISRKFQ